MLKRNTGVNVAAEIEKNGLPSLANSAKSIIDHAFYSSNQVQEL
jgi:hypothetical protein